MANSSVLNTSRQILPVLSLLAGLLGSTVTAAGEGPGLQTIPPGYHLVASEIGVPAEALYRSLSQKRPESYLMVSARGRGP